MSITPSDFLSSAKQLLPDTSEISTRNAISRAYYAAFHQARSVFPPDPDFAKKSQTGMHQTYINQLMEAAPGSNQRTTAVKLSALKGRRAKADYRLTDDFAPYLAATQVEVAESIFKLLELPPSAPCAPPESVESEPIRQNTRPKLQRIR